MDEDLLIQTQEQTQASEPLIQEEKVEEPQPMEYKEPEVEDTYDKLVDEQERAKFMKDLESQYPIKGNASLDDVNTKDPSAVKKYFENIQDYVRSDIQNEAARQQAIKDFESRQSNKHWESAYKAYPKLKEDKETREFVNIISEGAKCSPLAAAKYANKLITQVYNKGFEAARSYTKTVPSKPLGNQQKSAPVQINKKAMNDRLNYGSEDDIAEVIAAAAKAGIGGL